MIETTIIEGSRHYGGKMANLKCPCGSGRKFKCCCGLGRVADPEWVRALLARKHTMQLPMDARLMI